ncbi:MAG: hypothetical protein ACOZJZ_12655, partial [Pseudomonadota bacterium]
MSNSSDGREFRTEITADPTKFERGMRSAAQAAMSASAQMDSVFKRIGDAVANVNKVLMGFTAALAGAAVLKRAIDETALMTEKAMDLGRALGVTATEAQAYRLALEDIGADEGEFEGAAKGLARQLRENEQAMNKLGLVTRNASGELRPLNELVLDGIAVLNDHKEGTDRALASQQIFGRGIDGSSKLLLLNKQAIEESAKAAQELGLEVGENSVRAWREFDAASDRAGFSIKGVVKAVGDQLMPVATDLTNVFNAVMPGAIVVLRGALGGLAAAFHAVKNGIVVVWETINAMVVTVAEPIRALGEAIYKAMTGDFQGAAAAIKGVGSTIASAWGGAMDAMAESSQKTAARISALFGGDAQPAAAGGQAGTKTIAPPKDNKAASGAGAEKSRMGEWEAQLAEKKAALQREGMLEGQFREMSKAEELRYWDELKARRDLAQGEKIALARKSAEVEIGHVRDTFDARIKALQAEAEQYKHNTEARLEVEQRILASYQEGTRAYAEAKQRIVQIERQAAEQQAAIEQSRQEAKRLAIEHALDVEEQAVHQAFALGLLTQEQMLQKLAEFEQRRFQIAAAALDRRLELAQLDPDRNAEEIERINRAREQLQQQHGLRMNEINNGIQRNAAQGQLAIFQSIEQGIVQVGTSMLTNWNKAGQALRQIFRQIGVQMIQEMILKPLAARVVAFAKERLLTMAGIGGDAAKAGSGAAASQASIPYVGPILALAAMAAVFAAVSGMASNVPSASAAGGFDIPASLNPITQLHAKEMVLPAKHADVIRSLADGQAPV